MKAAPKPTAQIPNPRPQDVGTVDLQFGTAFNVSSANEAASEVQPEYDVLVIGGGIHGVGVAQAAAADGYRVAVLEKSRLAEGTSSRSSKPWMMKLGLLVYSILAGGHKDTRFRTVPKSEWSSLDGLNQEGLKRVLQYTDGQTNDAALTRAVMKSAQDMGADLFYPAIFRSANIDSDGVDVTFQLGDNTVSTKAKVVVNAAGPWANDVMSQFTPALEPFATDNVQGTHIECAGTIDKGCYYVEADDGRVVFVMPWQGRTLIGTTEANFTDDPDKVTPLEEEVAYLKAIYVKHFPDRDSTVINQWAGLRVLPAATGAAFKRSRETQLPVDNNSQPRVLSIFGGKLTGYRATGEKVMKILKRTLPKEIPVGSTRELTLIDPQR